MLSVLLVNLALIAMVVCGLVITANPLCIMALFFLRDMTLHFDPSMLMQPPEDAEGQPMGFTADLDK